jgi:hypothetical protein
MCCDSFNSDVFFFTFKNSSQNVVTVVRTCFSTLSSSSGRLHIAGLLQEASLTYYLYIFILSMGTDQWEPLWQDIHTHWHTISQGCFIWYSVRYWTTNILNVSPSGKGTTYSCLTYTAVWQHTNICHKPGNNVNILKYLMPVLLIWEFLPALAIWHFIISITPPLESRLPLNLPVYFTVCPALWTHNKLLAGHYMLEVFVVNFRLTQPVKKLSVLKETVSSSECSQKQPPDSTEYIPNPHSLFI